ncbi:MAG: zf-HC2 domain-containing protein [Actinobacteria bacterium]|nr:zf-HC2 domain-containing protein [Actinomycetota bacterium]
MRVALLGRLRDRLECRRVRTLLQAFVDGELDARQRSRVEAHLAACRRCGLDVATYTVLIRRLHGLDRATDPDAIARLEAFVDGLVTDKESPADDG